jgi:hypothetical protein
MYINVKVPRVVQIQYVERPADKLGSVAVKPDFFDEFGDQLGEIYCISNIQDILNIPPSIKALYGIRVQCKEWFRDHLGNSGVVCDQHNAGMVTLLGKDGPMQLKDIVGTNSVIVSARKPRTICICSSNANPNPLNLAPFMRSSALRAQAVRGPPFWNEQGPPCCNIQHRRFLSLESMIDIEHHRTICFASVFLFDLVPPGPSKRLATLS